MKKDKGQFLVVDELHEIYYEVHGNEDGKKILFLHGGPGIGSTQKDLEFFDLNKVTVVLIDQRGCGKSIPKGELKSNTSEDLVEDINKVLIHLNYDRVYLFGGSWGSTLSLLFGIKYPNKVEGMILRGLFTATVEERAYFEKGSVKIKFPEIWNRFESKVPIENRSKTSNYYFNQILYGGSEVQEMFAYELSYYGVSLSNDKNELGQIDQKIKGSDYVTRARILSHYSLNDFFLPDNYIIKNTSSLSTIPIRIVQGLKDNITLAEFAIKLSEKLKRGKLTLVEGGHSPRDKKIKEGLIKAVEELIV